MRVLEKLWGPVVMVRLVLGSLGAGPRRGVSGSGPYLSRQGRLS